MSQNRDTPRGAVGYPEPENYNGVTIGRRIGYPEGANKKGKAALAGAASRVDRYGNGPRLGQVELRPA